MLKTLERFYRYFFPKQLPNKKIYIDAIKGKEGIEIGGPTGLFNNKGILPIYKHIRRLDGCNFGTETVWEGHLREGEFFSYNEGKGSGHQYIADAVDLSVIPDGKYDFLLSSHSLEHIANPLKALQEWKRILKKDGLFLLILPWRIKTFDHRRPATTLAHIKEDFLRNIAEDDTTHFEEAILLHDISRDHGISSKEELTERVRRNIENRCLHHHIFEPQLVEEMIVEAGFKKLRLDLMQMHIILLAQKK